MSDWFALISTDSSCSELRKTWHPDSCDRPTTVTLDWCEVSLWRVEASKFSSDRVFYPGNNYSIFLDGVVLNSLKLAQQEGTQTWSEALVAMYENDGSNCFGKLRGNFSGILVDHREREVIVYTDHFASERVFYMQGDGWTVCSSQLKWITDFCGSHQQSLQWDLVGAYSLLVMGCMYGNHTLVNGIVQVPPGTVLKLTDQNINTKQYYHIPNSELQLGIEETLDVLTTLFLEAVNMQLEKNKEYGWSNFMPLSGGLDSRMTVLAARRLGVEDAMVFTYSQTGEWDSRIPCRITSDIGFEWLFRSLDAGLDLCDIDLGTLFGQGLLYYIWPAQLDGFMRRISHEDLGLVHTGVAGGGVIGGRYAHRGHTVEKSSYRLGDGAMSVKFLPRLREYLGFEPQMNYEEGMFRNRCFNGTNPGYLTVFRKYSAGASPFLNVDFFDFCLSLPMKQRALNSLYYRWVLRDFPEASSYSHNGFRISKMPEMRVLGRNISLDRLPSVLLEKGMKATHIRKGMNPFDRWYKQSTIVRTCMDDYFLSNLERLKSSPRLFSDCQELYDSGSVIEKIMALSLVSATGLLEIK